MHMWFEYLYILHYLFNDSYISSISLEIEEITKILCKSNALNHNPNLCVC